MAGELDGQITSEAIGALDNDRPDAIAGDPLQHGQEAGALGHGLRNPDNVNVTHNVA